MVVKSLPAVVNRKMVRRGFTGVCASHNQDHSHHSAKDQTLAFKWCGGIRRYRR